MHFPSLPTKAKTNDHAGVLLELAGLPLDDPDLQRTVWQWNQAAPYLDNLPIRLRSIPQYLTVNETTYLPTGGIALCWKALPEFFAQYHTGGQFEIEVPLKLADRFVSGASTQIKHQDNLLQRPEYLKTFGDTKPIQFFKRDPGRAKAYFEEESLRAHGPEFLLATATIVSVEKQDNSATLKIRIDNIKEKDRDLLPPFLRHLAYEYSLSLNDFLKQLEPVRAALNHELGASAAQSGEPIPRFLHQYSTLCLASPKQFSQLPPRRYLEYLQEKNDPEPALPSTDQLLAQALAEARDHLPRSFQNIMIVPGEDSTAKKQLLEKTGATKALLEHKALLEQIAGPNAVNRLAEILLNIYFPEKPLDYKHIQNPAGAIELQMPVSAAPNSAEAEEDLDRKMALKTQLQERALYDHQHDSALEDPVEFNLQYRQAKEHANELNEQLRIETSPSFIGALRYTPDHQTPYQTGYSYPQRIALAIEAITPAPDLLPLKRLHYTGPQLMTFFNVPNVQANQDMARRLALALCAGRQENQVDRAVRGLLGSVHYHNQKPNWTTEQAASAFAFACANSTRPAASGSDKPNGGTDKNYYLPQLSRISNPIPFLLRTGAFEQAAKKILTLEEHQKLDLVLRAQTAITRHVLTTGQAALAREREQALNFPQHFVLATQLALHQPPTDIASQETPRNPLAATLGIRIRAFNAEEASLPIPLAAQLLNVAATTADIEQTLQQLEARATHLLTSLERAKTVLTQNPAYQLSLDPDHILKGLRNGEANPAISGIDPQTEHEPEGLNVLLNSLHQGRKANPWTASACLLITAAEQSAGKENSVLINIPGEKPVELKIRLTTQGPALRLTTGSTEPNGQIIFRSLNEEIGLLYNSKTANTLSPTETLNFQQAGNLLQGRRIPAILSELENLLVRQDGLDPLKTFVRGFRAHLKTSHSSHPNGSDQYTLAGLSSHMEKNEAQLLQAKEAITQKQPEARSLAEHLALQTLVDKAYPNHTDKPPGLTISATEIHTNRLWILHTLKTLAPDPVQTANQSEKVLHAMQEQSNPFTAVTPPVRLAADATSSTNRHYTIHLSSRPQTPEFQITPHPFQQPYHTAKANRAFYKLALQHALETGVLELPSTTPARHQHKRRDVQNDKPAKWNIRI